MPLYRHHYGHLIKLLRARDQTRFSSSRDIWFTNKKNEKVTDSAKNRTLLVCGNYYYYYQY